MKPDSLPLTVNTNALLEKKAGKRSDDRFRQMIYDLLYLESQMREIRDRLGAALGIPAPGYAVLMTIAGVGNGTPGEGIRVRDVAARLHVTGAFVTAEVNKLVAAKLVRKSPDPEDGRAVRLALTPFGHERIKAIAPSIQAINDHMFGDMTSREFQVLAQVVARIGKKSAAAFFDAFLPAA